MKMKFTRKAFWIKLLRGGRVMALVLLALALVWKQADPGNLIEIAQSKVFDLYQRIKPRERPVERPVMVVDIDEDSLAKIGQWPWSRVELAKIVANLASAQAAVVAFDIVFAEEDRMSPGLMAPQVALFDADTAARLKKLPTNDAIFADIISRYGKAVLGQTVVSEGRTTPVVTPEDLPQSSVSELNGDPRPYLDYYEILLRNIPILDKAAAGRGIFNVTPEIDGIVRRIPAVVNIKNELYPALSVEMLRVIAGRTTVLVRMPPTGLGIQDVALTRDVVLRTDPTGRIYLYAGHYDRKNFISAKDVLDNSFNPALVAGKAVVMGTSAAGLLDIRTTAVDRNIPGVDLHAQIIESVLSGQQLQVPATAKGVETLATILAALLMIILAPAIGARWTLLVFLAVTGLMIGGSWYSFAVNLTLYDPAFATVTALLIFLQMTYAGYASEEAQRRQVREAFARYLSPALVEQLASDPTRLKLGGEKRDMTLLFCDIRGFTTISEIFRDPQDLTRLINRFLTPMTNVILERRGTIDKYMGDCIMAFWNAPLDDNDHARHACESALTMMERLNPLNDSLEAESKVENRRHVPIKCGIGLNSGPAVVGNMGADSRFDYSVLGDTVNLASRLEGQSKPYGVYIVIGDETRIRAPDYAAVELDLIKVKGKTEAVRIWALLGRPDMAGQSWYQTFETAHNAMLSAYRAQNWTEARRLLAECDRLRNDLHIEGFYALMAERIAEFEANPPGESWDGVYTATSK